MSNERLPDRWMTRDFPVLVAVARRLDAGDDSIDAEDLVEELGLEERQIAKAMEALGQADFLEVGISKVLSGEVYAHAHGIMERGRRAVGLWPSGEAGDALVDALRQAEELVADPDEKTLVRRAAGAVGSVSRDVMVDVMAAVIARQSGVG